MNGQPCEGIRRRRSARDRDEVWVPETGRHENEEGGTRLSHVDEAALSRGSQLIDLFAPRHRQRYGMGEFLDEKIGRQRLLVIQRAVQAGDHGLLDFRPTETCAGVDELREIEL